ncbi:hypothetical protein NQ314_018068 [Rhamnusium bicolor]|uniref:Uncharacterized protein n=1 Tax=Rhamnusium bicolor TaxID=1586634 RepID=A0AAV8WR86_9CUCU|nr:hypothetical protein NQ314_018068 [Rhamnusium bicolor]
MEMTCRKKNFERNYLSLKKKIIIRANSVAVGVCCSAKMNTEEELVLFNKVFPNTPLLGLNADGEIGWNCFMSSQESTGAQKLDNGESKAKKPRQFQKVQHQWSTILVFITWGAIQPK